MKTFHVSPELPHFTFRSTISNGTNPFDFRSDNFCHFDNFTTLNFVSHFKLIDFSQDFLDLTRMRFLIDLLVNEKHCYLRRIAVPKRKSKHLSLFDSSQNIFILQISQQQLHSSKQPEYTKV